MSDPSVSQSAEQRRLVELMIAYQGGNAGAFEQLYALLAEDVRRHFARVHRDRAVVSDLVQDTFLEMHRSRRTYSPPLPVRPWVFGIARNVSVPALLAPAWLVSRALPNRPAPTGTLCGLGIGLMADAGLRLF